MDVHQEIQSLLTQGLKFSIELDGRSVLVWVGDYLRQSRAAATVSSLEQAVEWLQHHAAHTVSAQV